MKMRGVEKRFVNSRRHSSRVASQAEQRLCPIQTLPGQRLLDVGCGNGAAPIHLARTFGLEIVGVDVDPEQIEAAIAASSDVADCGFLAADATELPFADGKFDLVHASKTTHHIHDWP